MGMAVVEALEVRSLSWNVDAQLCRSSRWRSRVLTSLLCCKRANNNITATTYRVDGREKTTEVFGRGHHQASPYCMYPVAHTHYRTRQLRLPQTSASKPRPQHGGASISSLSPLLNDQSALLLTLTGTNFFPYEASSLSRTATGHNPVRGAVGA